MSDEQTEQWALLCEGARYRAYYFAGWSSAVGFIPIIRADVDDDDVVRFGSKQDAEAHLAREKEKYDKYKLSWRPQRIG